MQFYALNLHSDPTPGELNLLIVVHAQLVMFALNSQ